MAVAIAFVDDHPVLLEGIRAMFARRPGYEVVATGACCADAVLIARQQCPDVILLDLNMPGDAFDCIKQIRRLSPDTKIVAFTASAAINHAISALQAGANGYVLKGNSLTSLVESIDSVIAGETYISKGFASKVITALSNPQNSSVRLSVREEQIINLLLEGRTNREIAEHMNLGEKTIKNYLTIMMQKLKVSNRVGLAMAAQQLSTQTPRNCDVSRIGLIN